MAQQRSRQPTRGKLAKKPKGSSNKNGPVTDEHAKIDPKYFLFFTDLALGASIKDAAAKIGWNYSYARKVKAAHPELVEAAAESVKAQQEAAKLKLRARAEKAGEDVVTGWSDMHNKALQTVHASLDSEDDRVALQAAELIIERVEGRVPQKIEGDLGINVSMQSIIMRFVTNVHLTQGVSIAEAMDYAQQHPEEVDAWADRVGARDALPAGGQIP